MSMLNSVIVEGRIYPEYIKEEPVTGTVTAEIGTERIYRGPDGRNETETSFIPVVMWGSLAGCFRENAPRFGKVRVVGRMKQERWTDSDGRRHSKIELIAEHVDFAEKKNQEAEE